MERIVLSDGRWFDAGRAQSWEESRHFDGRNFISNATGSQWEHEQLYLTASGRWVLNEWTQWQGGYDTYREISEREAAEWLVRHDPEAAARLFPEVYQELQI